ncbi:hypothetical protein TNCV_302431 [Trichonephila clavipes]|nr:hypothetical protein TNCV_302431 [Trichonephila clavipes]
MRFDTDQGTKCLKATWTLSGLVCGIGIDPDVLCIRLVMGERFSLTSLPCLFTEESLNPGFDPGSFDFTIADSKILKGIVPQWLIKASVHRQNGHRKEVLHVTVDTPAHVNILNSKEADELAKESRACPQSSNLTALKDTNASCQPKTNQQ